MKDPIIKWVNFLFVSIFVILVAVAIVSIRNVQRSIASNDWVNHTHSVISEIDYIRSSVNAGDASLCAYFVTANNRDLTACRMAYSSMKEHLDIAKALTQSETNQSLAMTQLEDLLAKRVDLVRGLVNTSQNEGMEAARKKITDDAGGDNLANINNTASKIIESQKLLLQARDKASFLQAQTTRWTVMTGLAINFLLLILVAVLIRDDISARQKATTALEEANAILETKVQERTAELAKTNENLKAENLERHWANQSLEHQLRYSQLIINSINELIFVLTKTKNISRINPAVVHITGFASTELINSPLSRVVRLVEQDAGSPGETHDVIERALKEGRDLQDLSAAILDKEGRIIPASMSLFPLRDDNKVVGGVVTVRPKAS